MNKYNISIQHSIFINKPRELVWDYTQDYTKRKFWDRSVKDTFVLEEYPNRIVKVKAQGNITMTFEYKQDEKPYKTSLVTTEIQSQFIALAGGSWIYDVKEGGTLWTQKNTLQLKPSKLTFMLLPIYKWMLNRQTRKSMKKAKQIIENL